MDHPWCRPLTIMPPHCITPLHCCCHQQNWPRPTWHPTQRIRENFLATKPPKQLCYVSSPARMLRSQVSYLRTPLTQVMGELPHSITHVQLSPAVRYPLVDKCPMHFVGVVQHHVVQTKKSVQLCSVLACCQGALSTYWASTFHTASANCRRCRHRRRLCHCLRHPQHSIRSWLTVVVA